MRRGLRVLVSRFVLQKFDKKAVYEPQHNLCLFPSTRTKNRLFLAIFGAQNIEVMSNLPKVRWGIIGKSGFIHQGSLCSKGDC